MNDVIHELISKQIHTLPDEIADAEIYRVIQAIDSNYILLNKTKKSVDLTQKLNKVLEYGFTYTNEKMPIGITFEELLLKSMAFQSDNPFEYIKERCIDIPKTEEVMDYLNGVDLMYKLSGEKNPDFTSNELKLTTNKFKERNNKQFDDKFKKLFNVDGVTVINRSDGHTFYNEHILLEFIVRTLGTEAERETTFLSDNSPTHQALDEKIQSLTEDIFGRKFNIHIVDSASPNRRHIKYHDGNTIIRNERPLYQKAGYKSTKRNDKYKNNSHFSCYAGLFLHYNQFCDVISKGSLK